MFQLSRDDMASALNQLGEKAAKAGKVIDLCVYGGSCLMLVSDFREASRDVDAVAASDQPFVDRIAGEIAEARQWPSDWLNDGVRTYLSPLVDEPEQHLLFATYPSEEQPGLRVYTPTAEYMLAMKLMALRIDDLGGNDRDDILNLMEVVGITSRADLIGLAADYYPEAAVSGKLLLSADTLVSEAAANRRTRSAPPSYAGRSGPDRNGG